MLSEFQLLWTMLKIHIVVYVISADVFNLYDPIKYLVYKNILGAVDSFNS